MKVGTEDHCNSQAQFPHVEFKIESSLQVPKYKKTDNE